MKKEVLKKEFFSLHEITQYDKELLNQVFISSGVISNFTCFEQFYSYLDKPSNHLYVVTFRGKQRILLHRDGNFNDVRIFFEKDEKDKDLIQTIINHFNPDFIGYNIIQEKPITDDLSKISIRNELIIDIMTTATLNDKSFASDYRIAERRHPNILYRKANSSDKNLITDFLYRWYERESNKIGKKMCGENIQKYIDLFIEDDAVHIGIVIDDNKVIGLTSSSRHPSDSHLAVSTFSMIERGYKQLGVFTKVQQARALQDNGYKRMLIGGTESKSKSKFKMRFMKNGSINTYYSEEVYRKMDLETNTTYLRDFWA